MTDKQSNGPRSAVTAVAGSVFGFCDVVIPKTRLNELTYRCDRVELSDVGCGDCVWVSLRGRRKAGVVFARRRRTTVSNTLPLMAIAERRFLPVETVAVIDWVSYYYCCRKGEALTYALPAGRLPVSARGDEAGQVIVTSSGQDTRQTARRPDGQPGFSVWVSLRPEFSTTAAVVRAMRKHGSTILLAPESRLAEWRQLMAKEWGGALVEFHGETSERERRLAWQRLRFMPRAVVVGVRSAVMAPVRELAGIIVIDEHRGDFKEERRPRFHARDVAIARGRLVDCPVFISDATPSAETWLNLRNGTYRRFDRASTTPARPSVLTVDMRRHRGELLSPILLRELRRAAEQSRSSVLYLNRRGVSRSVVCRDCSSALVCSDCGLPLVLTRNRTLECRWCGKHGPAPESCPECKGSCFEFRAPGMDAVAEAVRRLLPGVRVSEVVSGEASEPREATFLIGTRALLSARWPEDVAVVAAVDPDVDLSLPDFRARERTFQVLSALLARAGSVAAEVVIQTRRPGDPAIDCALSGAVAEFMDAELRKREELGFPPYRRLALIELRRATLKAAEDFSRLLSRSRGVEVLGPVPVARGGFRLLVKLPRDLPLARVMPLDALDTRAADLHVDVDPLEVI